MKAGIENGIHIGIIPDGSRRWAKKNRIKQYDGRQSGNVMERIVVRLFEKYPYIKEVSIWAISTENLERPQEQKENVYRVLEWEFEKLDKNPIIYEKDIRVSIIGSRFGELPEALRNKLIRIVDKTKQHKSRNLNVCIGYGGRQEILDAVMASSKWLRKNPTIAKLHEDVFERFLLVPKPLDILIRTGGEKRLSGFMLYQIEYAELFFTETLWPDFSTQELDSHRSA